jgi:carbon-monoxide dehydrogenase small subunit
MHVSLTVNGQRAVTDVEPRTLLVHLLREELGLTGTHVGCDTSYCGACTVIVDGNTVKSCTMLAVQAQGAEVTTIEGLAANGDLHPIQEGFWERHGLQCGFCTPGQVVAGVALLNSNPNPTEEEARVAMSGNLCRCGAYEHYLRGVMKAAREI